MMAVMAVLYSGIGGGGRVEDGAEEGPEKYLGQQTYRPQTSWLAKYISRMYTFVHLCGELVSIRIRFITRHNHSPCPLRIHRWIGRYNLYFAS